MKQNFEYRNAAFDMLKADWKGAVLLYFAISIIPLIIGTVLGSILGNNEILSSFSSLLLEVFVSFPLVYLLNNEILKFVRGGKIEVSKELVEPFKADYLKAINVFGLSAIYIALWTLLLIIPGIIKSYSYRMAAYISMNNENLTAEECINLSMKLMNGNKMKLFLLDLSFIGWILLSIITLGIGFLWVAPYNLTAQTLMFEDIMKTNQIEKQ